MTREIIAIAILVALLAGGIVSAKYAGKATDELVGEIRQAQKMSADGDTKGAEQAVAKSHEHWEVHDKFAHTMLRNEDVDNVCEAYFELLTGLQNGDSADALFDSVCDRLEKLSEIQKPTIDSIF